MMRIGALSITAFANYGPTPILFSRSLSRPVKLFKHKVNNLKFASTTRLFSSSVEKYGGDRTQSKVFISESNDEGISHIEHEIASQLSIPILSQSLLNLQESDASAFTHCIRVLPYEYESLQTYAIGIQSVSSEPSKKRRKKKDLKSDQMQPIFIDFCPPLQSNLGKRVSGQKQGGEMLLKAVAAGKYGGDDNGAIVYDLTAGFGQDSMIIAGGKIKKLHMIEREPIVALLLGDAIRRLNMIAETNQYDERAKLLAKKLVFHQDEAVGFCATKLSEISAGIVTELDERPHVCYLDPMFPPRKKSAAVKKNMQILHGLFHTNEDIYDDLERRQEERDLLNKALALAKARVVVKRPINAPPLGSP